MPDKQVVSAVELNDNQAAGTEIASLQAEFKDLKAEAVQLTAGLSDQQFNWHRKKRWSISECVGHLNLTAVQFLVSIESAIQRGKSEGLFSRGEPFKRPALTEWFIKNSEPPYKRLKFKSPKGLVPPAYQPMVSAIDEFINLKDRAIALVESASGLDLERIKVMCPELTGQIALGNILLKFTLAQSFALLAVHERRHLWQAWQVRNDPEFPKDGLHTNEYA
jgi:hypothetical protein